MNGLIGRKLGMTRLFNEEGTAVPVTVIEAGPCPVVQVAGDRVQLGFEQRKATRTPKALLGHAKKAGLEAAPRILRGKRMPGHMGAERFTELGLKIVKVDAERNLLFVRGAVPGPTNGLLTVRKQGGRSRHD